LGVVAEPMLPGKASKRVMCARAQAESEVHEGGGVVAFDLRRKLRKDGEVPWKGSPKKVIVL
jgi:hypothetical protein